MKTEKGFLTSSLISPASYLRKRFTLVELLVVVAIIAILAGMLLPALNSARQKGIGTSCMSQQKQIGVALQNYVDDFNGFSVGPYASSGVYTPGYTQEYGYWTTILMSLGYFGKIDSMVQSGYAATKAKILYCPLKVKPGAHLMVDGGGYGMFYMYTGTVNSIWAPSASNGESAGYIVKLMKAPSEYGWVGDSWSPGRHALHPRIPLAVADSADYTTTLMNGAVPFWHNGYANILMVPGNVRQMKVHEIQSRNTGTWTDSNTNQCGWKFIPYTNVYN